MKQIDLGFLTTSSFFKSLHFWETYKKLYVVNICFHKQIKSFWNRLLFVSFHEQLLEMWPQCITHVQGIHNMSEMNNVWKTLHSLSPFTEAKDRATDKTEGSVSTAEGNIKCYDTDIYCRIQIRRRGYPTWLAFPFLFFLRSKTQNLKIQDMFGTLWWQIQQPTKKPLNSVCMCIGVCFIRLLEELLFLEAEWKKSWSAGSFKAEEICKKI